MKRRGLLLGALLTVRSDGKSHDYHDELVMSAGLFIKWF
jgi:hypothetical protein